MSMQAPVVRSIANWSVVVAVLLAASVSFAAEPVSVQSREQIEQIVQEYIASHPEVISEALKKLREQRLTTLQRRVKESIAAKQGELFQDPTSPTAGQLHDGVRIVEFFDYRCPYCKTVSGTVMKVIAENPNVRVIFKELPILGPDSLLAAKAALAAQKQDAYLNFHTALMRTTGVITQTTLEQLAQGLSLDVEKLKVDMETQEIHDIITNNRRLASALAIESTPTFVVESELATGALNLATFQTLIAKAQAKQLELPNDK